MRDRFDRCLDGLLPESGAVLLAVSGGIDSMVMADLFLDSRLASRITLAHCNFHLRGEESDADCSFVKDWAASHDIPFREAGFDTCTYAREHGVSIEMAARELRYSWFASLCDEEGFKAVAVAHNANDNAETLLLNMLRGTGLKGICGMRELSPLAGSSSAVLIRPLLGFSREEIHEYAVSRGLDWREDSTNADPTYKRNLIRNEVFPLLAKVNPSFLDSLVSDMRRFSQVQEVADGFVARYAPVVASVGEFPSADHSPGQGAKRREAEGDFPTEMELSIDVGKLKEVPHWEYLLYRLMEPYGFNESVIEDLTGLIKEGKTFSGREFRSADHIAATSRDSIGIVPFGSGGFPVASLRFAPCPGEWSATGNAPLPGSMEITGPGEYSLDGIRFVIDLVEVTDPKQPEGTTVVDIAFPFPVRRWQPGDWMRPLGLKGCRKKLSDMFGDLKFTPVQKAKALVIAGEGSHVLALLGYRVDESVALKAQQPTRRPFTRPGREAQGGEGVAVPMTAVRVRLI